MPNDNLLVSVSIYPSFLYYVYAYYACVYFFVIRMSIFLSISVSFRIMHYMYCVGISLMIKIMALAS